MAIGEDAIADVDRRHHRGAGNPVGLEPQRADQLRDDEEDGDRHQRHHHPARAIAGHEQHHAREHDGAEQNEPDRGRDPEQAIRPAPRRRSPPLSERHRRAADLPHGPTNAARIDSSRSAVGRFPPRCRSRSRSSPIPPVRSRSPPSPRGCAWRGTTATSCAGATRMIVLTLEPGEAEKLAEGAPTLQRRHGMPIDPAPYPRPASSEPACRAVVAARLQRPGGRGAAPAPPAGADDARRPARRSVAAGGGRERRRPRPRRAGGVVRDRRGRAGPAGGHRGRALPVPRRAGARSQARRATAAAPLHRPEL